MSQACTMLTLNFAVNKYMPKICCLYWQRSLRNGHLKYKTRSSHVIGFLKICFWHKKSIHVMGPTQAT